MAAARRADLSFTSAFALVASTVGRRWRTCFRLVLPYAVAVGLTNAVTRASTGLFDPATLTPSQTFAAGIAAVGAFLVLMIVQIFIAPVTVGALSLVGSAAVYGDAVDAAGIRKQALNRAFEVIGAVLLTSLLLGAVPLVLGLAAFAISFIVGPKAAFAVLILGIFPVMVIPLTYVAVRLSLTVVVVMREGRGPVDAMRRSWSLVRGAWWWVFGILVVPFAIAIFATGNAFASFVGSDPLRDFLVGGIVNGVAAAVSAVLYSVAMGVVYAARTPDDVVHPEVAEAETAAVTPVAQMAEPASSVEPPEPVEPPHPIPPPPPPPPPPAAAPVVDEPGPATDDPARRRDDDAPPRTP